MGYAKDIRVWQYVAAHAPSPMNPDPAVFASSKVSTRYALYSVAAHGGVTQQYNDNDPRRSPAEVAKGPR